MKNPLTKPLTDLPSELAGFGCYNAAIVAWRFARRGRGQVSVERWVEAAKWAADQPVSDAVSGAGSTPPQLVTMMDVLDRLGLTKKAAL
jgi:hypothetical protein